MRIDLNEDRQDRRLMIICFKADGKFKSVLQQLASYYDTDISSLLRTMIYLWYKHDYPLSGDYTECMFRRGQGVTDFDNFNRIDDICVSETEYEEVEEW